MAASRNSVVTNTGSNSFNITVPAGIRGIHLLINSGVLVTAVSVGGVAAAQAAGSPNAGGAGEIDGLFCSSWLIGSSLPAAGYSDRLDHRPWRRPGCSRNVCVVCRPESTKR